MPGTCVCPVISPTQYRPPRGKAGHAALAMDTGVEFAPSETPAMRPARGATSHPVRIPPIRFRRRPEATDSLPNSSDCSGQAENSECGNLSHGPIPADARKSMGPPKDSRPSAALHRAIDATFGSQPQFEDCLKTAAPGVFVRGWAWSRLDDKNQLLLEPCPNQDSP
jgi:hypothetical protein